MKFFVLILALLGVGLFSSCQKEEQVEVNAETFEDFMPKYNRYIRDWLSKQEEKLRKEATELEKKLAEAEAEPEVAKRLKGLVDENQRSLDRITFRQSLGDYFAFKDPSSIPEGLVWQDGMENPEIGDPAAKKGGAFNYFISSFPPTLRPFGSESNNSFRGEIYDNLGVSLVTLHPETLKVIPGLAQEWAVSEDKRTVYFKVDPEAQYNDGVSVKAGDFQFAVFLRVSDHVKSPYAKQYFREQYAQITVYDDLTLAVTLADAKPLTPSFAGLSPMPPHFYREYGPDYEERYNWKVPPTTGAYYVKEEDVVKGVSITLSRAKDWWARDKKFYRYRYNPDRIRFQVIRDVPKSFELFRAGELDYFRGLILPEYWYEKSESREFFDGYIEKHQFYHKYPHIPRGLYLNVAKGILQDRDVRVGLQYAANLQKVIDVIFRGDYERLDQFAGGYREYTDPSIKARSFSIEQAREHFRKAGFTNTDRDGVLMREDGTRLSVTLSYAQVGSYPKIVPILKEEAFKAGLEIRLDGTDPTLFYQQVMKKEHEMVFWGWGVGPPFPNFYQFFHSRNARDEAGNLKQQTNNLNSYGSDEMDRYALGMRHATTLEEMRENAWAAQKLAHEEALFIPGWREPFARVGAWRWMKWPESEETEFAPSLYDRPRESYVWWIDEEVKEQTLEAKRKGESFPEQVKIHDRYRANLEPLEEKKEGEGE